MDVAEIRRTFSSRIRKLREEHGLNQGQFADSVGVSRGAMSYYEQEARTPDISVLHAIAEKYGVSADYLIGLIPDQNHAVSDICRETGLLPKAAKRLQIIKKLHDMRLKSSVTIVAKFDDDVNEALQLVAYTAATPLVNTLISTDEGLTMLNLLSAVIFGAELETGSDDVPWLKFANAHRNIEIRYPVENLTAALWVNIQEEAGKLREKVDEAGE